jgi:hypothetical protein
MNNAIRIVLLLIGFVALALPGGCSWWFTPAVFWSLQEPDPFGSSRPLIADTLLFWPLGLATALGGYRLLQGAWRRDLSAPAPRWLLTGAGLLLLMSAGSIVVCGALGYLPQMLERRQIDDVLLVVVVPLASLILGIVVLWRAINRPPEPPVARGANSAP